MKQIYCHPAESVEDSSPESISDTENWLNRNGDLDNLNDSKDNCTAEVEFDIVQGNGIDKLESPEQWDIGAAPSIPELMWTTQK